MTVVYEGDPPTAGMVKGMLEDAGMMAFLQDEAMATIGHFLSVKVAVPSQDADRAKSMVQEFLEGSSQEQ